MLHRNLRSFLVVSFVALIAATGLLVSPKPASANSGSIPEFSVGSDLHGFIRVSCPDSVGFDWQVAVDDWKHIHVEQTTDHGDFTLDGSRISNGHHNAIARVHCNGESWEDNPGSSVGFDWYGGNPTPVPLPPGYEVSISLNVAPTLVPPDTAVKITVQAACSNTNVRAIRVKADGNVIYQLGSPVVTTQWSTSQVGDHTISAEAACNGDDSWHTTPNESVGISVQADAVPSGGGSDDGGVNPLPTQPPLQPNVGPSSGTIPEARNQDGIHASIYCERSGRGGVVEPADNDPYGWKCADGKTLDMNLACKAAFGDNYSAVLDQNARPPKYGWRCRTSNQQPPQPPQTNNCPPAPSRLNVGDIAIVSDADPYPLLVWANPSNPKAPTSFTIPIREQVSIIEAPFCLDGLVWVKIGYNGRLGFAVEVSKNNSYNLIPNGEPMPSDNGGGSNPGPTPTPSHVWYYPVATGMGSPSGDWYAYVPGNLHSLFCRTSPQSVDRSNVKATFRPNDYFTVVETKDGWVRVQSSLGDCWVSTQYAKVTDKRRQAEATEAPVQPKSEIWAKPPYSECSFKGSNPNSPQNPVEAVRKGFTLANARCNPDTGEIYLFAAALGGSEGDPRSDDPTRQAIVSGEMVYVFTPNFTGDLRIDATVRLNGKLTLVASGMATILPTLKDKVKDTLVELLGRAYLSKLFDAMNLVTSIRNGSHAYVSNEVYLYAISSNGVVRTRFSPTISPQEVIFPGTPSQMAKHWEFDSLDIPVSIIVPVQQGMPIEIHTGIKLVCNVYGMAYVQWLPSTSQVTSIVLTQTQ